ncbi:MAG: serine/threonine-protein kinase [Acidobacteriota bacterium]|nr:serine/threonine-protein kinase [Acidobacteriota bacterium]
MTPERWQVVEEMLQAALDRPAHERASFIAKACIDDDGLKREAISLIDAYDEAGDFIEQPAMAHDAQVLIGGNLDTNIGRDLGPYRIVERIGAGGMGEVYLALDSRLDRLVALKMLPVYFASDDERLRRFQREARAASALNHPNILTIHEVGESEGVPFMATEFIHGQTIRELIVGRELSFTEVLDVAEQVASALSAAHSAGIVHRDIKPENIMRRTDGLVKILDFGIAKLMEQREPDSKGTRSGVTTYTEAGTLMGTVNYMSPEQARGLPVDERTDIWSLGVVLYEMSAHELPFTGATRMDTIVSILEREPHPLRMANETNPPADAFKRVVAKTLRKGKTDRYQTTAELLADLKNVRQLLESPGQSTNLATRSADVKTREPSMRRYVWPLLTVALVLMLTVAGIFLYKGWLPQRISATSEATAATPKPYVQMSEAERFSFIDQQEQRISTMMGDRPVKLNDEALRAIKTHVDRYVERNRSMSTKPGEESLSVVFARARPYVPLISRSFAARKIPVIIGIYLPVIESAYRNCYENSIGAKGLFQFLPQTAEHYGVAPQDMCDVEKMTPAAAHYIADRMAELGEDSQSVTLVLLSYNRGPEWVRNTLRELRGTDNYERNFWTLFAHRDKLDNTFRDENAGYVPNFFAAAIIGENPESFELPMPALSTLSGTRATK